MSRLDPSAAALLKRAETAELPSLIELSAAAARKRFHDGFALDQAPFQPVAEIIEIWCGTMRLKCWRGMSAPAAGAPALMYTHGGGWLFGSPETHEEICRRIANLAGAVVVAPDYRLAPEAPFPSGLEDCADALRYMYHNASGLGIDPGRIAVGGDSSGGNLAAVLALMARDAEVPKISAQLLFYPNTDQQQSADSFVRYARGFGLTAAEMAWFRGHYLPEPGMRDDWRAAPLQAKSLVGVAPAVVVLAGHDILYSEGAAFAERLRRESRALVKTLPGQIHGFLSLSAFIPEAHEALAWACIAWAKLEA
jgi:acetyl esterase